MTTRRYVVLAALAGSVSLLSGCGNSSGLYPVSGQVTYRGEPAKGAVVYFHRAGGTGSLKDTVPYGIVEEDGSFELNSDSLGYGALPGTYAVLVEWREEHGDGVTQVKSRGNTKLVKRSRLRAGQDRLKGRYLNISKPLLHAEVKPQSNRGVVFELAD